MSIITRGTTPYHRFTLPVTSNLIDKIYITYMQGNIKVEKSKSEVQFETQSTPHKVLVHLSQQDTMKFKADCTNSDIVEIQMDIKTTSGERLVSKVKRISIGRLLKEEVI